MPLNRGCIGKRYSAAPREVTIEALQDYARACNDLNPRFFDSTISGGIVAPPMFAMVVSWVALLSAITDPELHVDFLRLLHTAQDMDFFAPIRPGDIITGTSNIASIERVAGGETMAVELEARNRHDEILSRNTFTVFIRGRRESAGAAESRNVATTPEPAEPLLTIAQAIDPDQTFRYAEASGDRNPIHVDENVARMAGLPGIIVHGLCTMAFASKVVVDNLCDGEPERLKRFIARFSRPVFPGQTITTRVWPTETLAGRQVFAYQTNNPDGFAVIREGLAEICE
jgi:acyl dehydratase